LDRRIETLVDIPHTISFVIRKRMQIDSINELPKEKRPSEFMIWDGGSDELDEWFDKMFKGKEQQNVEIYFSDSEIEG
jgi:hypothetical protein